MAQMKTVRGVSTSIRTENGRTIVRYHDTDVVSFDAESVELNTGGWKTATTKTRMNQAANQFGLPYRVYQKDHAWFVRFSNGDSVPFMGDVFTLVRSMSV
jgi:hypothetical protein